MQMGEARYSFLCIARPARKTRAYNARGNSFRRLMANNRLCPQSAQFFSSQFHSLLPILLAVASHHFRRFHFLLQLLEPHCVIAGMLDPAESPSTLRADFGERKLVGWPVCALAQTKIAPSKHSKPRGWQAMEWNESIRRSGKFGRRFSGTCCSRAKTPA